MTIGSSSGHSFICARSNKAKPSPEGNLTSVEFNGILDIGEAQLLRALRKVSGQLIAHLKPRKIVCDEQGSLVSSCVNVSAMCKVTEIQDRLREFGKKIMDKSESDPSPASTSGNQGGADINIQASSSSQRNHFRQTQDTAPIASKATIAVYRSSLRSKVKYGQRNLAKNFDTGNDTRPEDDLRRCRNRANIPLRALNDWRAWTAELLSKTVDDEALLTFAEPRIHSAVEEVLALIGSLAEPSKVHELGEALYEIYLDAVRLAVPLWRQRAVWIVQYPSTPDEGGQLPLTFEPNHTQDELNKDDDLDVETLRQQLVEIAITPALLKRGNANGEHLDRVETAVPAFVAIYGRQKS
ncbi:MAG: hypothetical protein Q9195_004727 [Heterodermia aff. obscurata]